MGSQLTPLTLSAATDTQCIRCGLLLHMLHVAWSVCLSVRHTMCHLKTAEPI